MDTIDASTTGRAPRASSSADIETVTSRPPVAYTISEFCLEHKISPAYYYKMRKFGLGPREMILGRRRLVSAEDAAAWRRDRAAAG